ncbi:MAG: hypothetical protein WCO25_03695 [Candidatus Uhrbacteria bacterium]
MDNESPETAKLTVRVFVRNVREERWPNVSVTTVPDSVGSSVARGIRAAISDHVVRMLPAGQFQFDKSAASKYTDARLPAGWTTQNLRNLTCQIQSPVDAAFLRLREALSAVPDEETAARIVRDLYASIFHRMVVDGTATDARPGFGKVIACRQPAELDSIERHARDRDATVWREELSATRYRAVFVHENRGVVAYVGVAPGEWPFGSLVTERYDRVIARVHDRAAAETAHETFQALARTARQTQFFSDAIGRAYRFAGKPVFDDGHPVPLMGGGTGEA